MMDGMTPLTAAQAARFTAEVPFERRFHVSFIGKHGGFEPIPVFSVRDFVRLAQSGQAVLSPAALATFVEDAAGDIELADAVRAAIDDDAPLFDQARAVTEVVAARLAEAEALLAKPDGKPTAAPAVEAAAQHASV